MSERRWGAYDAPRWAASQRFGFGGVGLKATLMLLAQYADEDFSCYPSQKRIAEETDQHVNTVGRQLELLEDMDLFHREHRYAGKANRKSDRYFLHLDVTVGAEDLAAAKVRAKARKGLQRSYPQAVAVDPTTHHAADVSAGQELPTTVVGSSNYPPREQPTTHHNGGGKELLERELLERRGVGSDLDLTRGRVRHDLSTGVGRGDDSDHRSAAVGAVALEDVPASLLAALHPRRSRPLARDRRPGAYLDTVTAYAGRDEESRRLAAERLAPASPAPPSEEPDATP